MNFKNLSILFFVLLAFSSCTNEDILTDADMTDAQLIQAIQQASKQVVDAADLPSAAASALSSEFPESYNQRTELAADLGYEVRMEIERGNRIGDSFDVYFNLDGRLIGDDRNDDDGDRPNNGSTYDCPDLQANIGDECRDSDGNIGLIDSDCECDLD